MRSLLSPTEESELVQCIAKAESGTSGEIRIHFDRKCSGDPVARAARVFRELEMHKTVNRNAVLLYIALDSRKIAIYGDQGIHEKLSQEFWNIEIKSLLEHFSKQKFFEGLQKAVSDIGEKLKIHFPAAGNNPDELPNEITIH